MEKSWVGTALDESPQSEWTALLGSGQITLAEYVGLSKKELYVIAKQAYLLLNSGKLEEAHDIYQGLVAADPYDSVFHCHFAAVLLRLGKPEEALKEFNFALQYNLSNIDALAGRGEIRLAQGEIKEAVADLRQAIELDTDGKRASTIRARAALFSLKNLLERQQVEESEKQSTL